MSPSIGDYYQPANVFRQPAIILKKRSQSHKANSLSIDTAAHHKKTWQNDVSKIGSPFLRKASDDFNDHYTTKKLKSEYWKFNKSTDPKSLPTALSIVGDTLLVSNMDSVNNLKMISIDPSNVGRANEPTKLHEIQTISVPGTPVMSSCLLPSSTFSADYFEGHDQLLLCGHQDGIVNLISTSMESGGAKIAKRYKHGKLLSRNSSNRSNLDSWLQSFASLPVRDVKPWNDCGFTSLVNDSLFIYDLNRSKAPQFLQSFPGLEAVSVNRFSNPYLLSLCGSQFGNSGVALLDLRSGGNNGNLYIPDCNNGTSPHIRSVNNYSHHDCTWIDEYHLANCVGDTVKIWDIRSTGGEAQCDILPMKGCIESLTYNSDYKTLYTGDDQGNIISWDLTGLGSMKKGTLAQGFNSILVQDTQELLHDVSQCGNIIVNGASYKQQFSKNSVRASTFMDTLSGGSLITLDSQELGLHQVCEIKCHTTEIPENTASQSPEKCSLTLNCIEYDRAQEDSDATLLAHDSSSSNHSDCSSSHTLHSEEVQGGEKISDMLKHHPNSASLYSLKNLVLSGSTICQEVF